MSSGRDFDSYMGDAEAFSALSEEDQARLMAGETLDGETDAAPVPTEEISETPAADETNTETPAEPAAEDPPVVLARDGQHTIPFAELEAARERARQLEQEVLALKSAQAEPAPPAAESPVEPQPIEAEIADLRRQYRDAMYSGDNDLAESLEAKIDAALDRRMEAKMEAREAGRQEKVAQETEMSEAQTRAAALVEKYQFLNTQGPETNQKAIDLVVLMRNRFVAEGLPLADAIDKAVGEIAPLFSKPTTQTKQPDTDAASKAAEVISKAKAQVPTSLSQVPAGSMAYHDEGEAIRNMNVNQLSRHLEGKSPAEIEQLMNRVL